MKAKVTYSAVQFMRFILILIFAFGFNKPLKSDEDMETKELKQYEENVVYAKGQSLVFPDFSLRYIGERKEDAPEYVHKYILFHDFEIFTTKGTQNISWSLGTDDITPTVFSVNGSENYLEKAHSIYDKSGWLQDNEIVVSTKNRCDQEVEKGYEEMGNKKVSTTTLSDLKKRMQFYDYAAFKKLGKISNIKGRDQYQIEYLVDELENSGTEYSEGQQFALIDGDVEIDGNFFLDLLDDYDRELDLVWISGDLKVSGTLYSKDPEHYYNNLVVEGSTHVKNVISAGTSLYFLQDLKVDEIYYVKENDEGGGYTGGRKNIKIYAYNELEWTINNEQYQFYGYHPVDMSYEEAAKVLDRIFLKRFNFWASDDDKTGFFLEEDLFIDALLQGKKLFKEKIALPIIETWLAKGRRAVEDEKYKDAISFFSKVLEKQPHHFEALFEIGAAHHNMALEYQNPSNVPDFEVTAFTVPKSIASGKKALEYYEQLFQLDAKKAGKEEYSVYYLAGEAHELLGNKEKAIEYYSKQVEYTNDEHCKKRIKILKGSL